jgi:hypothetical protein
MFLARQPPVGHGLIHEVSRLHIPTHHSRYDSSGRVISSSQRTLPENTQLSQQTYVYSTGGIPTHNPSTRTAAYLRIRPSGHWDLQTVLQTAGIGPMRGRMTASERLIHPEMRRCNRGHWCGSSWLKHWALVLDTVFECGEGVVRVLKAPRRYVSLRHPLSCQKYYRSTKNYLTSSQAVLF